MHLKDICPLFVQKLLNLNDLRIFFARFCREDLRTFSADFFGLKNEIRKLVCFLDVCMTLARTYTEEIFLGCL